MRRSVVLRGTGALAVAIASAFALTSTPGPAARTGVHLRPEAETLPADEYLNRRLTTGNHPLLDDAFTVIGQQQQAAIAQTAISAPQDANSLWTFDGPTNIDNNGGTHHDGGGRVPDVATDSRPGHLGTVYIATAGGGVWKTTDGGATIASTWPVSLPQAIGAVAVGPDGTVWVGTGETNPGGGSITFFGDGVYKSTDGGATWTNTGLNDSWTISRIVVDPTNANHVWVAVSGNLFLSGHQRGVYVTSNAGSTWTQSLAPPNGTTGASDLAISLQHPGTLYAAMWDHVRVPDHRTYTGPGSGIWKTTDNGATWADLTSATNAVTTHLLPDGTTPGNGRIGLAVAPSDDSHVYAQFANDLNGVQQAFFASTDSGASFTVQQGTGSFDTNPTGASYVYGWWFAKTFVDPQNPLHVFVTGLNLWSSTNGGASFSNDTGVHADQHAMAWENPADATNKNVYLGDDGGFYRSTNNGAIGSFSPATYQPWPQFDGLDVSEQDSSRIIGGLQDNGSQRSWDRNGNTVPANGWNSVFGGDGQQNLINPQHQNIVYSCLQYGVCQVSTDGGNSGTEFDTTPLSLNQNCFNCTHTLRNVYFTPMAFDPTNPSTVYYAGDVVNVSNDDGVNWRVISPNLGGNNPGTETDPLYAGHFGAVTTISVSRTLPDEVWVGTDSGLVWKTTNASSNPTLPAWTQISGLPVKWVSKVYIDPTNPQIVYVAFSGYRAGDNSPFVERTNDGGTTWTDLSGNLPQATVNDLVLADGRLWAATDTGVYASDVSQNPETAPSITWRVIGSNLPNIAVTALRLIPQNNTLYVSTFGRGVWSLALSGPSTGIPETVTPLVLPAMGGVVIVTAAAVVRRRRRRSS